MFESMCNIVGCFTGRLSRDFMASYYYADA